MSVDIQCAKVSQRLGDRIVLDGVDWSTDAGKVAGVLGNSGAGKTTLLRIIAGLEQPTSGSVRLLAENQVYSGAVGMVFQNLGLWPHLTVLQHLKAVVYGDRRTRLGRCQAILQEMRLEPHFWDRRPTELSGGESQRLAIARALATDPKLLLLDEPLAHLDAALRNELLQLIRQIATDRAMTVVIVSHSWSDVSQICDQVAVLAEGGIVQNAKVSEVYCCPKSAMVAQLTGPIVQFPRHLIRNGLILDPSGVAKSAISVDDTIFIRPQQLIVLKASDSRGWHLERCVPAGVCWRLSVRSADHFLSVPSPNWHEEGSMVQLAISPLPS